LTARGRIKKVFPGCNTAEGFYSFYDHIIPPDATRIFIIKGGPGVGKSTFMRSIADSLVEQGFDVEFHCCSSDNGSLDGIVFPQLGVAIIDGTAPHVLDPRLPGAVDEIVYFGNYWDEDKIRTHKKELIALNKEVGRTFTRAYRFLKAAQIIYRDWEEANTEGMNFGWANQQAAAIIHDILDAEPVTVRVGRDRHLFARAITPDGMVDHLETIIGPCRKKYVIAGKPGTGKSVLIAKVGQAALERGYDVELYHCPLNPSKVEQVVIPKLNVALTKSIEPHVYSAGVDDVVVNMDEALDEAVEKKYAAVIAENKEMFFSLFNRAISFISAAKNVHDQMEQYYAPYMDFDALAQLRQQILEQILHTANSNKEEARQY
jgi:Cdc6-like AAA superfamily ATPase